MHCENICNGIETDYYSNGTIRLTGEFKNGLVIGELKRYYQSGKIKEISIYDKDGFWKETIFFEESEIIKKE
jgi:antitoxin component YwqK of YwqJK toxin-antitoxin module